MAGNDEIDRLRYLQLKKKKALSMAQADDTEPESSLAENFVTDAKEIGTGLLDAGKAAANIPLNLLASASEARYGIPPSETEAGRGVRGIAKAIPKIPGAIVDRAKEIVTDPAGSFVKRPISTTLDVASVAFPVLDGVNAIRGNKAVSNLARGAGELLSKDKLTNAAIRGLEAATTTPETAIRRRLARPNEVKNAIVAGTEESPFLPVADELARSVNTLGQDARKTASVADETLSKSKYLNDRAIPRDSIVEIIKKEKARLRTQGTVIGKSKNAAAARLDALAEEAEKLRGTVISEANIKKFVKDLDTDIDWDVKENGPLNLALERVRYRLDAKLKAGNPEYREKIAESARKTRLFKRAGRQLGMEKVTGSGLQATDATVAKLKSVGATRTPIVERRLSEIAKETGNDFIERSKDIDTALKLRGGVTNGSRKALGFGTVGAGVGGLVGGVPGAALGSSVGSALGLLTDIRGRGMASMILDLIDKAKGGDKVGRVRQFNELAKANPTLLAILESANRSPAARRSAKAYLGYRGFTSEDRP